MKHETHTDGFTLIEVMIYIALLAIVSIGFYAVFFSSLKTYRINSRTVDLRQNMRASLEFMSGELRLAGNPGYDIVNRTRGGADTGFVSARRHSMSFSVDLGLTGAPQVIQYGLAADTNNDGRADGGTTALVRTIGAVAPQIIADEVEAIQFAYAFDADGNNELDYNDANTNSQLDIGETIWAYDQDNDGWLDTQIDGTALAVPVFLDTIRAVRIWILGRTTGEFNGFRDTRTYTLGGFTVAGNNDAYKRRLLSTTINCRNMGL